MSTAAFQSENFEKPAADENRTALPLRNDTFLGVCEAIGQDFGFNPNYLRIPFAALILWNSTAIIGIYLALGCVVALTRWFFPAEQSVSHAIDSEAAGNEDVSEERLAA